MALETIGWKHIKEHINISYNMRKIFLLLATMVIAQMWAEGEIAFRWENPQSIAYRTTDTLRVASDDLTSFDCTFALADPQMAQYVKLNGDKITVLNCYNEGEGEDFGKIFIKATITNIVPTHSDTTITGYITTSKISPNLRWTCQLRDMACGDKVQLTSTHDNTDSTAAIYYSAEDYHSLSSNYVDVQGSTMTAINVGRGIFATVTIYETNNFLGEKMAYYNNDSVVRFEVTKGNRPIHWGNTDFKSLTNLSAGTELHAQYPDNHDSIFYSTSDINVAEITNGNYLKINGPGKVTVTAMVKESNNYYQSQSDTLINIPAANTTIYWEENVVEGQKQMITSTVKNYNLNVLVNSNYTRSTRFYFTSSDTSVAKVSGDTLLTCYRMGSFELSAYAVNSIGGRSPLISRNFDVVRGYMKFVKNGQWNDRSNWERNDLEPDREEYSVEMLAKCTIPDGTTAECHDLKIYTQGGIIVEPGATLYVANRLENNAGEKQLILKADGEKQGAVYFKEGNPLAEVEVWMNMSTYNGKDTVWEYMGMPVDTTYMKVLDGKKKIQEYSESTGWKEISSMMTQLKAWQAYRITDSIPSYNTIVGRLNPGKNHRFELSHTDGKRGNAGRNIIVNSYSAPIDLRAMEFEGVPEEVHYPAGLQWATAPKYTAEAIGRRSTMQPGDAMFVQADNAGTSITMDYDKAMAGGFADEEDFNVLKIAISGAKHSDTVVLVGCASGSGAFENGYDGTKWLGPDSLPQIFASPEWGRASVNAEQSIVGQNIGVIAANDLDLYRITFDTKRLKDYDQLYLFDMNTQAYVDIIAGEPYSFTTTRLGEEKRFTIMRDKVEAKKDKNGRGFLVVGNRVLLVGFGTEHALVRVMNAAGIVVYEFWSDEGPWIELPELMNGIYIINSGESYTKFYR